MIAVLLDFFYVILSEHGRCVAHSFLPTNSADPHHLINNFRFFFIFLLIPNLIEKEVGTGSAVVDWEGVFG